MGIYEWCNSNYNNTYDNYQINSSLNQRYQENNSDKVKYPKCHNCSSILLITKIDIINCTIDHKCEECFKEKKNETIHDFINCEFYPGKRIDLDLCKTHNKKYSYFCETCFRHNCDDCFEKTKYPKHKFYDLEKNKISNLKIEELNSQINEEFNFFHNLKNTNYLISFYNEKKELEKYKRKYSSDKLFKDKNFIRILNININEILDIIDLKNTLINYNIKYPNNYVIIQNIKAIEKISEKDKDIICENLIINSIKIFEEYKYKYLFKYMEIKTINSNIKNFKKKYYYGENYLRKYTYQLPFINIENTDLILFIDKNILCINIKTGEVITHFNIKEEREFDIYPYCLLTNNIFLVFIGSSILKFEFSENKIKQIQANFDLNFSGEIMYIYKIFNEHYLLMNENILFEKTPNNYEKILEIKENIDIKWGVRLIQVDYLRTTNEEYFIGAENDKHAIILIKFYFNSDKKITYSIENIYYLPFWFFKFTLINDTNLLVYLGDSYSEGSKFIIYDFKNRKTMVKIRGNNYNNVLHNIIPTIRNIKKSIRIKYYSLNLNLSKGYNDIYPLKKCDDGEYFISKNDDSDKYEFKIFRYKN